MAPALDGTRLLAELEPTVTENVDRHLATAKEWMPHEFVPWSQGRDFADLGGEPWSLEQSTLSPIARTALEVNLLTEDNLPSYHREVERAFGRDSAWGTWVNRWTAEEGRHAFCIRDYLLVTRGVDPEELERARMQTMETGFDSGDKPLLNVCAYVSFQELATRISHRNTGRYTEDPIAEKLLTRVAMDENLHMIFYRNLVSAALELAPNQTMRAITDEVLTFQMPGSIIPGFARKAVQIALAGIYDLRVHHDDVVMPLVRQWGLLEGGRRARPDVHSSVPAARWSPNGVLPRLACKGEWSWESPKRTPGTRSPSAHDGAVTTVTASARSAWWLTRPAPSRRRLVEEAELAQVRRPGQPVARAEAARVV